jgi:hypothetical protein
MAVAMNVPVRAAVDMRLLRAALFSAVCLMLSSLGHVLVSKTGLPLWTWAVGWVGVLCGVGPLAGRECSLPGITTGLVAGETGLQCSARLAPHGVVRILRQAPVDPARALGAVHGAPGMTGTAGHGVHAMVPGPMLTPAVLAAHVVAALIAGWLLRRGEVALWQVVRLPVVTAGQLARLLLLRLLRGLMVALRTPASADGVLEQSRSARSALAALIALRAVEGDGKRLRPPVLRASVVHRGPPATAAVT